MEETKYFKDVTKFHITCLTIGTRGDVQPYIALCKGLQRRGHPVRIATHLEYKEWIESHGIEFREVKGSPAALMVISFEVSSLGLISAATLRRKRNVYSFLSSRSNEQSIYQSFLFTRVNLIVPWLD